jgi:hypothetical protein
MYRLGRVFLAPQKYVNLPEYKKEPKGFVHLLHKTPKHMPELLEARRKNPAVQQRIRLLLRPWAMRFYYFSRLPSVWFWGVRVEAISPEACTVRLPFSWFSKNPFRSIYFAAQCGAAELSTGLLALLALEGRGDISMLVIQANMQFVKKASGPLRFTCEQGELLEQAIQRILAGEDSTQVTLRSEGRLPDGQVASFMDITWTFKKRKG